MPKDVDVSVVSYSSECERLEARDRYLGLQADVIHAGWPGQTLDQHAETIEHWAQLFDRAYPPILAPVTDMEWYVLVGTNGALCTGRLYTNPTTAYDSMTFQQWQGAARIVKVKLQEVE